MTRTTLILALSIATLALGACAGDEKMTRTEPVAPTPSKQVSATHAPQNAAERACTKALASQLGGGVRASDLSIISTDMSQGELWITVRVPSAEQPWACVLDRNGRVTRTQYMGQG
jgi:hypothetical protein